MRREVSRLVRELKRVPFQEWQTEVVTGLITTKTLVVDGITIVLTNDNATWSIEIDGVKLAEEGGGQFGGALYDLWTDIIDRKIADENKNGLVHWTKPLTPRQQRADAKRMVRLQEALERVRATYPHPV